MSEEGGKGLCERRVRATAWLYFFDFFGRRTEWMFGRTPPAATVCNNRGERRKRGDASKSRGVNSRRPKGTC